MVCGFGMAQVDGRHGGDFSYGRLGWYDTLIGVLSFVIIFSFGDLRASSW